MKQQVKFVVFKSCTTWLFMWQTGKPFPSGKTSHPSMMPSDKCKRNNFAAVARTEGTDMTILMFHQSLGLAAPRPNLLLLPSHPYSWRKSWFPPALDLPSQILHLLHFPLWNRRCVWRHQVPAAERQLRRDLLPFHSISDAFPLPCLPWSATLSFNNSGSFCSPNPPPELRSYRFKKGTVQTHLFHSFACLKLICNPDNAAHWAKTLTRAPSV